MLILRHVDSFSIKHTLPSAFRLPWRSLNPHGLRRLRALWLASAPARLDSVEHLRDLVHGDHKIAQYLLIHVFQLHLTHGEEESFHLLPEQVARVGGVNL